MLVYDTVNINWNTRELECCKNCWENNQPCAYKDKASLFDFTKIEEGKNNSCEAIYRHCSHQKNRTVDCCVSEYSYDVSFSRNASVAEST